MSELTSLRQACLLSTCAHKRSIIDQKLRSGMVFKFAASRARSPSTCRRRALSDRAKRTDFRVVARVALRESSRGARTNVVDDDACSREFVPHVGSQSGRAQ